MPNQQDILRRADEALLAMRGRVLHFIEIAKPDNMAFALQLSRIISKLSPIVGNLIEFQSVDFLNSDNLYGELGHWIRQDPGFPDALFQSDFIQPNPGVEIKAWFPLATEMTGRFRESQKRFFNGEINLCILAWLPGHLIYGQPQIIGAITIPCLEIAVSRDCHYSNPPDYLVVEPEDTSSRSKNVRQTNTIGHKWQDTDARMLEARQLVEAWELGAYSVEPAYQEKMKELIGSFAYRMDTNYAKLDRINNPKIERFKAEILNMVFRGMTINEWRRILANERAAASAFHEFLDIQKDISE